MKFTIREIDHVVIRVANIDAMTHFYCEVLGCHVEKEQRDIGLIQLRAGCSLIDLLVAGSPIDDAKNGVPGAGRNMDHVCLRIEPFDADALRRFLVEQGVEVGETGWRYGADGWGPSLYLSDPEGNGVELKGAPEMADGSVASTSIHALSWPRRF